MVKKTFSLLLPLLFSAFLFASSGEDGVFIGGKKSFEIDISPSLPQGAVVFESDFSGKFPEDYDTVLMQGEMPDPNVRIEIWVKNKFLFFDKTDKYASFRLKRYSNGRFWAKFRTDSTRNEFKFVVINAGVKSAGLLRIYEIEVFNSQKKTRYESGNYPEETQASTEPVTGIPQNLPFRIIRRGQWNANKPAEPYVKHHPKMFTIHHTAGKMPKTPAEAIREIQFIQDYHQNGRGWIDIGYHFLIDPFGNIYEGRPIDAVGAHVKGHNTNNVGISIMGNYHPPISDTPTPETLKSFIMLGRYLKNVYSVKKSSFYAHRELRDTDCPGDILYSRMAELRKAIFTAPPPANPANTKFPETPALNQLMKLKTLLENSKSF